jgi:hypothetical protein
MSMPAVGADNVIVIAQRRTDARTHRLFADVEMDEAGQLSLREELAHLLLKAPNAQHAGVNIENGVG